MEVVGGKPLEQWECSVPRLRWLLCENSPKQTVKGCDFYGIHIVLANMKTELCFLIARYFYRGYYSSAMKEDQED